MEMNVAERQTRYQSGVTVVEAARKEFQEKAEQKTSLPRDIVHRHRPFYFSFGYLTTATA